MKHSSSSIKKFLILSYISENGNPEKNPYISGNKTFLHFQETETLKNLITFQEVTFQAQKVSYVSRRTSKALKTKIYYTSPKKVTNKFFQKHFQIIVLTFSTNWIKIYYWCIKTLKAIFCVSFSQFLDIFYYIKADH